MQPSTEILLLIGLILFLIPPCLADIIIHRPEIFQHCVAFEKFLFLETLSAQLLANPRYFRAHPHVYIFKGLFKYLNF